MSKPLIVLSAPSGAGKTTITRRILEAHPNELMFSVSATTRTKRPDEQDEIDYYFLTRKKFEEVLAVGGLVEHEEIFGNYYGTPVSEIERADKLGKKLMFDIDVKGGLSIRRKYPTETLLIFIAPPDMKTLKARLEARGTESPEVVERRLHRAAMEMEMATQYDYTVINDVLDTAIKEVEAIIFNDAEK